MDQTRRPIVTELVLPGPLQHRCPVCLDLRRHGDWRTKISYQDMCKASEDGCAGCRFLRHIVQVCPVFNDIDAVLKRISWVELSFGMGFNDEGREILNAVVLRNEEDKWFERLEVYTTLDSMPPPWLSIPVARYQPIQANSDECFGMIQQWISQCTSRHEECQKEAFTMDSKPGLPDRVLHIGSQGGPRLIVTREEQQDENRGSSKKYAALSYRWGDNNSLLLEKENIADFQRGDFRRALPQTFRDAIDICRGLQIDYLWIDALCIIQNSTQDWLQQSSKMCNIYSNAYVTIAADAASNPQAGFLESGRRKAIAEVSEIRLRGHDYRESTVMARSIKFRDESEYFDHHTGDHADGRSYLERRGWILQESLLSPRVIHFTHREITWQCDSDFLCQCARWARGSDTYQPRARAGRGWRLRLENLRTDWLGVVEVFTGCHLTQPTDRLAAMAGLAQRAQLSRPGAQYHAGIWENDIRRSLLWVALEKPTDHTRIMSEQSIAPSWSWASITGRVDFKHFIGATDLEDIVVNNPCPDQYGSVAGLTMVVTSHLFRVHLVTSQMREQIKPDLCRVLTFRVIHRNTRTDDPQAYAGLLWSDTAEDCEHIRSGADLLIANCRDFETFLVLQRLPNTDFSFRRVGLLNLDYMYAMEFFRDPKIHKESHLPEEYGNKERITLF